MSSTPEFIAVKEQLNKPGWGYDVQKIPYLSRVPTSRIGYKRTGGVQYVTETGNPWILQEIKQENGQYVANGGYFTDLVQPPKFIDGHGNEIETTQQVQDVDVHLVDRVLSAYALDPTPITLNVVSSVSISQQGVVSWTTGTVDFEPFVDYVNNGVFVPSTIPPLPDPDAIQIPLGGTLLIAGHSGKFDVGAGLVNRRGSFFPNSNKKRKNTTYTSIQPYTNLNFPLYRSTGLIATYWILTSQDTVREFYREAVKEDWDRVLNDPAYVGSYFYGGYDYASFAWE